MMLRVSVIIPAYNAAATIAETLGSVANQTLKCHEVIVVDDGSSDGTCELAQMAGANCIRQKNQGVAVAFNAGLALAGGDVLTFLDADDVWTPDCLAVHVGQLSQDPKLNASIGLFEEFVCPTVPPEMAQRFSPRHVQPGWLSGATAVRRDTLRNVGEFNPDLRVGAWVDWFGRLRELGIQHRVANKLVLRRRLRPGTLSTNRAENAASMLEIARLALSRKRPRSP